MNQAFTYRKDYFLPALFASLLLHGLFFTVLKSKPETLQFSIQQAPSSVEVKLIKEIIKTPPPVEEKKKMEPLEEIITAKNPAPKSIEEYVPEIPKPLIEDPKPVEEKKPEPIVEKIPEPVIIPEKNQGAIFDVVILRQTNPAPFYPQRALRRGWEGTVLLKVTVNRYGKPVMVEIQKSSGFDVLDQAAQDIVQKKWSFQQAAHGPLETESTVIIPFEFQLIQNK